MIWFIINANHFTLISQGFCLPCYNREQKILMFTFSQECSHLKILNMYFSNCCQGQEGILPLLCIPAYLLVQKCQFQYQLPGAYLRRLRHHLEKSEMYISLRLRRRLNRWYGRQGKYLFSIFLILQYMVYVRGQLCVIRYKMKRYCFLFVLNRAIA